MSSGVTEVIHKYFTANVRGSESKPGFNNDFKDNVMDCSLSLSLLVEVIVLTYGSTFP